MAVTAAGSASDRRSGFVHGLVRRQLDTYPETASRYFQLGLVVLVTVALYYELYVGGSVSTLQLAHLNMSFTFYVTILAFGNLIGAFGSLLAGLTDRIGRCNLVVAGLAVTGVLTAFVIPTATTKWPFSIEYFFVGLVEGICLVATPALIRDFSPQVGRASAMAFWTMGPVLGSLVVSVVGTNTIHANTTWQHEYRICGIAGLVVFAVAALFLRELAPALRDQLMVSMKDRALVEARAKGIDVDASLRNPWGQLVRADVILSAVGISVALLIYYTAVAFGTIYFATIFGFSLKDANGLANWNWSINILGLILAGVVSDRLRVRKPLMVFGGVLSAVMIIIYLLQAGHHPGYYTLALIISLNAFFLGIAYTSWMASFTETVEAHNPALTATGLAIWGWIIRVVIFVAFLVLPAVVNTVTPLVNYGSTVQEYATKYAPEIAFAQSHQQLVAFAQTHKQVIAEAQQYSTQLTDAAKFAPELAVIQANPALFTQLASYPDPTKIPPALIAQAVNAAGGGAQGQQIVSTIAANKAAILGVIQAGPALQTLAPYATQLQQLQANQAQLEALAKVPPSAFAYLQAHGAQVEKAAKDSPGQWQTWYWICVGGLVVFLLVVPLMRGRWSPSKAKADEEAHEALVQAELAKLNA